MDAQYTHLKQFGRCKLNEPLAKHMTFKIGGPADYFLIIEDTAQLVGALNYLDSEGVPRVIIGGGSNMLMSDEGYRGVVIQVKSKNIRIDKEEAVLEADAGCATVTLAQESMKAGLTGFEWGVGVPGTIGGATRGNAGAMGKEIKDSVLSVDIYRNGEIVTLEHAECTFGYRDSRFKTSGEVILRVRLKLQAYVSEEEKIQSRQKMMGFLAYRNTTQPKGFASTGCIFKNPDYVKHEKQLLAFAGAEYQDAIAPFARVGKISAGWLVERSGMKGASCGGALISSVHGNFVVNNGHATASEVRELIAQIQERVYTTTGIHLEEEIQYI